MKNKEVNTSADKVKRKKKIKKWLKLLLLLLLLLLLILYIVFGIIYNNGNFSVTLDRNLYLKNGIIIYNDPDYKVYRTELYAETMQFIDNITASWLPEDIHNHTGGSHNGKNYVAYTFFIENLGENVTDYWSELVIEDVVKNVDEAIRVRVYKDDEEIKTYAKAAYNNEAEPNTISFHDDILIARNHVENFAPGDCHKYTLVLWLEGKDPECTDNILGGEFKIHMDFKSEVTDEKLKELDYKEN